MRRRKWEGLERIRRRVVAGNCPSEDGDVENVRTEVHSVDECEVSS